MHLLEVPLELIVLHLRFAVDWMLQFGEHDFIPLLQFASVSHGEVECAGGSLPKRRLGIFKVRGPRGMLCCDDVDVLC